MAGLVSSAMQPAAAPMAAPANAAAPTQSAPGGAAPAMPQGVEQQGSKLANPALNQIETGVEAKIAQKDLQMYQSIVVACMDLAYGQKTHQLMLKGLQSSPDIYKNVSLVCAGMIGMVFEQVKPDVNAFLPAAVPASVNLMCQLLEFAEKAGMIQLDDDGIAKCTDATVQAVLRKFGVDGGDIKQAVETREAGGGAQGAAQPSAQPLAASGAPQQPMQGA